MDAAAKLIHAFISSHADNGNSCFYGLPHYQIKWVQDVHNTTRKQCARTLFKALAVVNGVLSLFSWVHEVFMP